MKVNFVIIIATAILFFSCTKESSFERIDHNDVQTPITKADTYYSLKEDFVFSVTEKDIWAYIERQNNFPQVRSMEPMVRDEDTLLFIVNLDNGWRVFSADKHLPPVVAEIPEGSFDNMTLENPGLRDWMESMMNLTFKLRRESDVSSATDYTELWVDAPLKIQNRGVNLVKGLRLGPSWTRVKINQYTTLHQVASYGPLLQTKWGQQDPWNMNLPCYSGNDRFPNGCVAVAVSQLLYYYHNAINCPTGLYHSLSISDWVLHSATPPDISYYTSVLSRTDYQDSSSRWGQMIKNYSEYYQYYPNSIIGTSYVSDLMIDVGNRANMHYYADGSGGGATDNGAQAALVSYGLSSSLESFSCTNAYSDIINSKPLYMGASDVLSDDGHSWVIDGVKVYQNVNHYVYQWWLGYMYGVYPEGEEMTPAQAREAAMEIGLDEPEDGMITYETVYTDYYSYKFHMNWGWSGISNGYYFSDDIVSNGADTYRFAANQQMVYNIHASSPSN